MLSEKRSTNIDMNDCWLCIWSGIKCFFRLLLRFLFRFSFLNVLFPVQTCFWTILVRCSNRWGFHSKMLKRVISILLLLLAMFDFSFIQSEFWEIIVWLEVMRNELKKIAWIFFRSVRLIVRNDGEVEIKC